jgi:hypothetical protein
MFITDDLKFYSEKILILKYDENIINFEQCSIILKYGYCILQSFKMNNLFYNSINIFSW